ncbi:MAG: hypothetical protein OXB95_06675, partial [Rhodobacteraceae bacterium]|nr:hypothetical protein [Paracoccaceae bacterium]
DRPLAKALEFHLSLNTVCFHGDGLLWPDKVLVPVTFITGILPLQANVCELSGKPIAVHMPHACRSQVIHQFRRLDELLPT